MRASYTYSVGCWETSDPTGNGGAQVATFSPTTDSTGTWSGTSGCTVSDTAYANVRIGPNLIWSNTIAPAPPVPAGAVVTIARGATAGGGRSYLSVSMSGMRSSYGYTVQCWETNDSTGNGGSQVGSFGITTDGSGQWAGTSSCTVSDSLYSNLRIGPNYVWSNTVAPVLAPPPPPPSPPNLTISRGPSAGTNVWWVQLSITGMSANTTYAVQCWETTDPTGNGGFRAATFNATTNGSGAWSGSSTCALGTGYYINLRIGPNIIWSNTIHF